MMATSTIVESALVLTFNGGLDEEGEQILLNKSFRNIKAGADYDALLAVVQKLAPLQQHTLVSVARDDSTEISA